MASFESGKGVSDLFNIFGGVGRLVYAPTSITYPTEITDILSDPLTGVLASGWTDFGATDGGITLTPSFDKEEWEVDQVNTPIDEFITKWNWSLETVLAESSLENLQVAWEGNTITTKDDTASGLDERTVKFGSPSVTTRRVLALIQDKRVSTASSEGRIRVYIFRRAAFNGAASSHELTKSAPAKIPIQFTLFSDTDITADNEQVMYILDQVDDN